MPEIFDDSAHLSLLSHGNGISSTPEARGRSQILCVDEYFVACRLVCFRLKQPLEVGAVLTLCPSSNNHACPAGSTKNSSISKFFPLTADGDKQT